MIRLSIVIPCYNEASVLPETIRRMLKLLAELRLSGAVADNSGLYFIDDGSQDDTWHIIERYARSDLGIHGLKLSRNCGHQNALMAGILQAPGDAVITIDADLQDDPGAIWEMLAAHRKGADVVYAVRHRRDTDTIF